MLPAAAIGMRNGSTAIAGSGSACGRRVNTMASPATGRSPSRQSDTSLRLSSLIEWNWSVSEMWPTRITAASTSAATMNAARRRCVAVDEHSGSRDRGEHHSELRRRLRYRESRAHSLRIMRGGSDADVARDWPKPSTPTRATTPRRSDKRRVWTAGLGSGRCEQAAPAAGAATTAPPRERAEGRRSPR